MSCIIDTRSVELQEQLELVEKAVGALFRMGVMAKTLAPIRANLALAKDARQSFNTRSNAARTALVQAIDKFVRLANEDQQPETAFRVLTAFTSVFEGRR